MIYFRWLFLALIFPVHCLWKFIKWANSKYCLLNHLYSVQLLFSLFPPSPSACLCRRGSGSATASLCCCWTRNWGEYLISRLISTYTLELGPVTWLRCTRAEQEMEHLSANDRHKIVGPFLLVISLQDRWQPIREDQLAMRTNYCWLPGQTGPRTNGRGPAILCLSFQFYLAVKSKGIEN